MSRRCAVCEEELTEQRLRAQPNATHCVRCLVASGDVALTVGLIIWHHKTAPEVEIGTKLARETAGKKHMYGPHIRMSPKTQSGVGVVTKTSTVEIHSIFNAKHARCHASRPRFAPNGLCLECALRLQKQRLWGNS